MGSCEDQKSFQRKDFPTNAYDVRASLDLSVQTLDRIRAVSCCRFRGHEDKIVTKELESGYDETEVQP